MPWCGEIMIYFVPRASNHMNFTVKYRSLDGTLKTEVVEAASRAAVFAQMKERGITPTSVAEGGRMPVSSASTTRLLWLKGALAGVLVVVAVVAAWLLLAPKAGPVDVPTSVPKKTRLANTNVVHKVEAPKSVGTNAVEVAPVPVDPNARPTKVGEVVNGYVKLPSGRMHKILGEVTNDVARTTLPRYAIFQEYSNNEIASLMTMEPGEMLVGMPRYRGRFKEDFMKALKTPIVIDEADDEYSKSVKAAVVSARSMLQEAMARGEDVEDVMLSARKELQELGSYRLLMQNELSAYRRKEGVTEADVEDFISAANKLLEERGIAPLKVGPITKKRMEALLKQKEQSNAK